MNTQIQQLLQEAHHHQMLLVVLAIYVFVLAIFVGLEVISKVPPVLHTPLMSGTNAIHGIVLVGAFIVAGMSMNAKDPWLNTTTTIISMIAVIMATLNVVGGFVVTDRMLQMFKKKTGTEK